MLKIRQRKKANNKIKSIKILRKKQKISLDMVEKKNLQMNN